MAVVAGEALIAALRDDIDRLLAAEPEVRADASDSVHQMRVATRRLRSVLRSYRGLFEKAPAAEIGAELKWLATLLGVARDAEVRADRFADLLDDQGEDVPDVVAERLVGAERARYDAAHAEVLTALDTDRYRALRERLTRWRTDPPLRPARAAAPAVDFFGVVLLRDHERVAALIRHEPTVPGPERIEALHDIRKSAKRLRYSCEAAEQVIGESAADLGHRAKRLQTVLGDHRDAVESGEAIIERAAEAEAAGEDVNVYRRLTVAENAAADRALSRYPETAEALSTSLW
ncbi:CHAD domain-containing protein [Nocardia amikacinitolerans]|uniref:CHAD domain-containing protein n=1 Tax=Nocardia amikacinitolerans TaxID=756689 RepID=A0A285LKG7_9NOCA|nr:CHAD domain-containing protein [Nocardia amikacinitolerans]MCP2298495.1 CHAD domain-containing protein [Nocardia amikacinitolerans]SNY85444.1 CHAD domain-containing protein [Nocardia amikacinitolerans]